MARERLLFIDLLKIVGILLVVVQHVSYTYPQIGMNYTIYGPIALTWGYLGVATFIFASGAGLAVSNKSLGTINEIFAFYKKRILRIYPAFWMSIIFAIAVSAWPHNYTWWDLFTTFSGFQAMLGYYSGAIMGVYWFIGLIITLYLLYPLLLRAMNKQPEITLVSSFIISIASLVIAIMVPWTNLHLPVAQPNMLRIWGWFPLCWLFYMTLGMYLTNKNINLKVYNNSKTVMFFADLSFYIFLVHASLLYILAYNPGFFVLACMTIAVMLYSLDIQIKRFNLHPFMEPWISLSNRVLDRLKGISNG